jgi:hypothetical protein
MHASIWARTILGVLVLSLAMSLPTIGLIVSALVAVVGAGALVTEGRSQWAHVHTVA